MFKKIILVIGIVAVSNCAYGMQGGMACADVEQIASDYEKEVFAGKPTNLELAVGLRLSLDYCKECCPCISATIDKIYAEFIEQFRNNNPLSEREGNAIKNKILDFVRSISAAYCS